MLASSGESGPPCISALGAQSSQKPIAVPQTVQAANFYENKPLMPVSRNSPLFPPLYSDQENNPNGKSLKTSNRLPSQRRQVARAKDVRRAQTLFSQRCGIDQVEEMVASSWRLGRLGAVETALFKNAITKSAAGNRLVGAFCDLATGKGFALVHRYQSSVHRMFQRSFKTSS